MKIKEKMAMEMKTFQLSVVIMFMLIQISQSEQTCHRYRQTDYGCPFNQLSHQDRWCEAERYDRPGFSFHIKPGNAFNALDIRIETKDRFFGIVPQANALFRIKKQVLSQATKWYNIRLWGEKAGWLGEKMAYHVSIDNGVMLTTELRLRQASKFIVLINGSPFYNAGSCNPANYHPPATPKPPPIPLPSRVTMKPLDLPRQTTYTVTLEPEEYDTVTSKNVSSYSPMINLSKPLQSQWWVFVAGGVALMIIITIIAIVMTKKRKQKKVKDINNTTFNNESWQMESPPPSPPNFQDPEDPANHTYDEPGIYNNEENVYESVDDLRGPIIYVDENVGQAMHSGGVTPERHDVPNYPNNPWQSRRGSAHDSENSLYGYI